MLYTSSVLNIYYLFLFFVSGLSKRIDFNVLNPFVKTSYVNYIQPHSGIEWPRGIIPFYFNSTFYDELLLNNMQWAMSTVERASSCITFKALKEVPAADAGDSFHWLHFTNPNYEKRCVHRTRARPNGEIVVVLGLECLEKRDILHALLHGVGFEDEITHPLRNRYVRVVWDNMYTKFRHLFRVSSRNSSAAAVEYDPSSVMHFHDRAYSTNGRATIEPLLSGLLIRPSDTLSLLDKMKLRLLFSHECNKRTVEDLMEKCKSVFRQKKGDITKLEKDGIDVSRLEEKIAENSTELQTSDKVTNEMEKEDQTKRIENINVNPGAVARGNKFNFDENILSDEDLLDKKI